MHLLCGNRLVVDLRIGFVAGTGGLMMLPAHFWSNTNFCPNFPVAKVDWTAIQVSAVPGVQLPTARDVTVE